MQETWVQSLGWEVPLEKEVATHSSILAWEILQTEEPGRLQSMRLQRVRHDWAYRQRTNTSRRCIPNTIPLLCLPFFWELGVKTYFLHLGLNTLGLTLGFSQNRVVLFSSFHVFPQCGAKLLLSSLRGRKAESCGSRLVSKAACAKLPQSRPTLCHPMDHNPPGSCPWDYPGKTTGVGYHAHRQGIFPTQGSNTRLSHLLGLTLAQPT